MSWLQEARDQTRGFGRRALAGAELAAMLGTGATVAPVYAGFRAVQEGLKARSWDAADFTAREEANRLMYQPRTDEARRAIEALSRAPAAVAGLLAPVTPQSVKDAARATGQVASDAWYKASAAFPAGAALAVGAVNTVNPGGRAGRVAKAAGHVPNSRTVSGADLHNWAGIASREELIKFATRKDPNGVYRDADHVRERGTRAKTSELRQTVREWARDIAEPTPGGGSPGGGPPDEPPSASWLLRPQAGLDAPATAAERAEIMNQPGGPMFLRPQAGLDPPTLRSAYAPAAPQAGLLSDTVLASRGAQYPPVPTPELKTDKQSGRQYLAKGESPETADFLRRRREAQADIDAGNYTPYFDVEGRFDVDPSKYPNMAGDTIQSARPKTQAKVDEWRTKIQTDDARARLQAAYDSGVASGGHDRWYQMGQLEAKFIEELGPVEGRKRFDEYFATAMAATTGGADPNSNLMMAHFGNYQRAAGRSSAMPAYEMPPPIGGRYVSGNMEMHDKVLGQGSPLTPGGQPKRHNFRANYLGNRARATVDEQMTDLITPGKKAPDGDSYFAYEELIAEVAKKNGVDPRDFQDVAWGGKKSMAAAGYTGKPMIATVNEAIERTSRLTGMPPDEVVKGMIHANKMLGFANPKLLGGLAAAGGAGAWLMSGDSEAEKAAKRNEKKRQSRSQRELEAMGE